MRERIIIAIGAILVCVLQLALAPHIAVAGVVPNLIVAYAMAVAITRPRTSGSILPFVLGLFYDVATGAAIGPMAFSLTMFAVFAAYANETLGNDTLFIPLVALVVCTLLAEFSYSVFMMALGYGAGMVDMLIYRTLPCFLYDLLIALALFALLRRLVPEESASSQPGLARLV